MLPQPIVINALNFKISKPLNNIIFPNVNKLHSIKKNKTLTINTKATIKRKPKKKRKYKKYLNYNKEPPVLIGVIKTPNINFILTENRYHCYILRSISRKNSTYCGITNNLARRLRKHNGEIVGGAKRTKKFRPWEIAVYVSGFVNKHEALSFEWYMHHPRNRSTGLKWRASILSTVITGQKWNKYIHLGTRLLVINWLIPGYELNLDTKSKMCFERFPIE